MNNYNKEWPSWYLSLSAFRDPSNKQAIWQLINTLIPYFFLWYLMIQLIHHDYPYIWTLLLAVPAALFLIRAFILFHDCVHGSFFKSKKANTFFGYLLGMLTFTSLEDWRYSHLRHHVTYANLDARGFGDIWTITLTEYENGSKKMRFRYRLYRNPIILFGLGALFLFLLSNRLPTRTSGHKEHRGILFSNILIATMIFAACWFFGWKTYLLIQLPIIWFAGIMGVWLFYVQHQFIGGYWAHKKDWDPLRAAMEGASFYKLPTVLEWFSGSIGYHHVHHLSQRIPNYYLKKCYESILELQNKEPLTFWKSFGCIHVKLWDENKQEMIPFP